MQHILQADYILKVHVLSYASTTHSKVDGLCCDRPNESGMCYQHCDNNFTFCLRPNGLDSSDTSCPMGTYKTGNISSDMMEFEDGVDLDEGVPNPLIFTGENWPVSLLILNSQLPA